MTTPVHTYKQTDKRMVTLIPASYASTQADISVKLTYALWNTVCSKLPVEYTSEASPTCHEITCICWTERGTARKIPWATSKYYPAIPAHQEPSWTASKYQHYPSNSRIRACLLVNDEKLELFTSTWCLIFLAPYHHCYKCNFSPPFKLMTMKFQIFSFTVYHIMHKHCTC